MSHSITLFMESLSLAFVFILFTVISSASAQRPPSPGYYPSTKVAAQGFNQVFRNLWGEQHQRLKHGVLTVWLDRTSGSGFKSLRSYRSGYFGASMKLQSGYTAGVITSFYLSNNEEFPGSHDEIDFEFLGTIPGRPYVLQTNVYTRSDVNITGREIQTHLWFDPTENYHHYAILWNPREIIFLVDDVPIRRYEKKSEATFPARPMWIYASIWDASSWATENGKYQADYQYQPFISKYTNFKIGACASDGSADCCPRSASPSPFGGLTLCQIQAMEWVQRNLLVYDYCDDPKRDRSLLPEC